MPNVKKMSEILEKLLMSSSQVSPSTFCKLLKTFTKLLLFNSEFSNLITVTHFTMACKDASEICIEFVLNLLKLKITTFGSIFKKWMLKNLSKTFEFKKPIEIVLLQDKCKSKFINEIGNYLIDELKKDSVSNNKKNAFEDILEILVEKHKYIICDITNLKPCKALLLQLQNNEDVEKCIELIIIPLMKQITKPTDDNISDEKKINLYIECLESLDYHLFSNELFKEKWPAYMKSSLKYGLKSDTNPLFLKGFKITLENMSNSKQAKNEAEQIYNMIVGHSQFVPIMFSKKCPQKEAITKVILTLIQNFPKLCSSLQIPIYLGAYNGTLSKSDQIILDILYVHEIEGAVNLQVFKPLIWGQAAIGKFLFLLSAIKKV